MEMDGPRYHAHFFRGGAVSTRIAHSTCWILELSRIFQSFRHWSARRRSISVKENNVHSQGQKAINQDGHVLDRDVFVKNRKVFHFGRADELLDLAQNLGQADFLLLKQWSLAPDESMHFVAIKSQKGKGHVGPHVGVFRWRIGPL